MYVCLCTGATSQAVSEAVAGGASTCKQVAAACGAGLDCGRCRRTVRDIISSTACQISSSACQLRAVSQTCHG